MDDIFYVMQTPIFWFVTVFLSILLNIFGAAIYDWLKIQVGKFSSKQRMRNEAEKERIEQAARKCAKSVKLITVWHGFATFLYMSAYASMAASLVLVWLAVAIVSIPVLMAILPYTKDIFASEADLSFIARLPDITWQTMSLGWQPLRWIRVVHLIALTLLVLGYYVGYKGSRLLRRAQYWNLILIRAGKLIEEDLEDETPDTDSQHPHTTEIQTNDTC